MRRLDEHIEDHRQCGAGEPPLAVASAPGRINLLGQHIDHQGGLTNPIAIGRRIRLSVGLAPDPVLVCHNADPSYPRFESRLDFLDEAAGAPDWADYTRGDPVGRIEGLRESWARYIAATLAHLAHRGLRLPNNSGIHIHVEGDIPSGAGLSSSSALVVASLLALLEALGQPYSREELVAWAGEAEHFVGTRGGCGDHAAIVMGVEGEVSHFDFNPFRAKFTVPFPENWRAMVCHSGLRAEKATGARQQFNRRVMAYHLGRLWMKSLLPEPQREDKLSLRDFLPPESRGLSALYKLLRKLPESASVEEIRARLNGDAAEAESYLAEVEGPEPLDLRGVCLFGLAEMTRARMFIEHLEHGDMERVVEIMYLSHDGDRIASHDIRAGRASGFFSDYSDERMSQLAHKALFDWGNPDGQAQLWRQPGRYYSSTEELDLLVDLTRDHCPRAGAHLVGAGLGGAIVVMCPANRVASLVETLEEKYFAPRGLDPTHYVFEPRQGAKLEYPSRPDSGLPRPSGVNNPSVATKSP